MLVTIRYIKAEYSDGSGKKSTHYKTFSDVDSAKEWLKTSESDGKIRESQLLVDYAEVDFYKTNYERLFNVMLANPEKRNILQLKESDV